LTLTVLQDFRPVKLQNIDFFTQVCDRILDYVDCIDVLLLIVDVNLNEQSVLLLLVRKCDGLVTSGFVLTADVDRSRHIENTLVLGFLSSGRRNVILDLVNFVFLHVAVKQ